MFCHSCVSLNKIFVKHSSRLGFFSELRASPQILAVSFGISALTVRVMATKRFDEFQNFGAKMLNALEEK